MTQFNIKFEETMFYEKLFSQCDLQKSGKVSGLEAYKLFLKSGLSIEDLKKICEYCGANRLGFFGRSQFYVALKIISLAQVGYNVDEELLYIDVNHPLPKFDHEVSEEAFKIVHKSSELPLSIPPPPNKHHMRTLSGNKILHSIPLSNRYSYSSPISKTMLQNMPKGSWDHFSSTECGYSHCENQNSSDKDDEIDEDDLIWDGYTDEDNKGLLNSNIKTDFDVFYPKKDEDDDNEYSSSSDHDSSSFSYETDKNTDDHPTGYTLMEAVEGLATAPPLDNHCHAIPTATNEQLEYYTKCFQTQTVDDNGKIFGSDAIDFFQMHNLDEQGLQKILRLTNIAPDSQITLIEFSRALHLITHFKSGFRLPDTLPVSLLPRTFEQPDEPFSFDLSDGEIPEASNNLSSMESSFSADRDSAGFDFTDVAVNRGWAQKKTQVIPNTQQKGGLIKSSNKKKLADKKPPLSNNCQKEELVTVGRPRPSAKKSISLSKKSTVAPPPPPRHSLPSESTVKKLSIEKGSDPSADSFSTSSNDSCHRELDNNYPVISESSKSEMTAEHKPSSAAQDTRKQLQINMRDLKAKNHVLLRLNNEMTSELEELHEQRVNLHLQLEYIKQSQIDIQ